MSLLFETIRIEMNKPVNLHYHEARCSSARQHLLHLPPLDLGSVIDISNLDPNLVYRCRVDYGEEIESVSIIPYVSPLIRTLRLVKADDIDYSFKYSNRLYLDHLFSLREQADDILIIKNGYLSDTSIANIVFTDGLEYYTPSTPLLKGTQRSFLLDSGIIKEAEVKRKDISAFKGWQHINALNPFNPQRFTSCSNITG